MEDLTNTTPEERFTKIENLLAAMAEHRARHDEDIHQIRQTQKSTEKVILRTLETHRMTAQILLTLAGAQKATEERLNALREDLDRLMRGPDADPA
jgi:hypothetical protein